MYRNTASRVKVWLIGLATTAVILGLPAGCSVALVESREPVTITVDSKERVTSGDSSTYLVFTDKGTFAIEDSLLAGRWNSSDVYGSLDEGETYDAVRQGWRAPFFSAYPNLIEIEEAQS